VDSRVWEAEWILHLPVPIQPHRGIETSISVLEQLRARFRNAFLLVGTRQGETGGPASPYAESLRQLRNSAGLEKTCVFAGEHFPASREMLRGWQRLADAVFLPAPVPDPEAVFGEAALWGMPVFHPEAAAHTPYGNGIAYPTAASPAEIAEWLIRQTGMRDPIQARRLARAQQSWPESYQKSLASFLEKLHN
jgi:hypothetical protein